MLSFFSEYDRAMSSPSRKRCQRYDIPNDAHCLTFSCFHRLPLLSRERSCKWMLDALTLGRDKQLYQLWAYVVMPEHVHLVLQPRSGVRIADILKSIKQSVSRHALEWLKTNEPGFLTQLEDIQPSGRRSYRFWQRGGGFDRNVRSIADIHEKINYVHENPVRRGLVSKASLWPWSSCHAWETGRNEPIAIDRASLPGELVIV
jgi:putative transposase